MHETLLLLSLSNRGNVQGTLQNWASLCFLASFTQPAPWFCIFQHSLSDASGSPFFEAWGWGKGCLPSEAQRYRSYVDQRRLLESYGKYFPPPLSFLPKVPASTPQFQALVPWMVWQHVASPRHILFFYLNTLSIGALIDEMDPSDVQLLLF